MPWPNRKTRNVPVRVFDLIPPVIIEDHLGSVKIIILYTFGFFSYRFVAARRQASVRGTARFLPGDRPDRRRGETALELSADGLGWIVIYFVDCPNVMMLWNKHAGGVNILLGLA
jgi:hypothetical protein